MEIFALREEIKNITEEKTAHQRKITLQQKEIEELYKENAKWKEK
jgi:hypothetical protein